MKNTIIFDLDGTLLPLEMKPFMKEYFKQVGLHFKDMIDPIDLMNKMNEATAHTIKENLGLTNYAQFMNYFKNLVDHDIAIYEEKFNQFYDQGFQSCKETTTQSEYMIQSVKLLLEKGYTLAIATNPVLPLKSNHYRIKWAGLDPQDFLHISSLEEYTTCKPHPEFYQEVLQNINKKPEECIMVGNDRSEDLIASKLGLETYLVTNCELDSHGFNIPPTNEGTDEDFYQFCKRLPLV